MKFALFATLAANVLCLAAVIYVLTGHSLPGWAVLVVGAVIIGAVLLRLQERNRR